MQEKIKKLYDYILNSNHIELTTKELYNCGFTSKDLSKLAKEGKVLRRIKKGLYEFIDIYTLKSDKETVNIITLNDIFISLQNQDEDSAFNKLHKYLIQIHKEKYEFLLIKLIEISLAEKDLGYSNFFFAIISIENGTFNFNIDNYISYFEEELAANNISIAKLYLELILKAKETLDLDIDTTSLEISYKKASLDFNLSSLLDSICLELQTNKGLVLLNNIDENLYAKICESLNNYPFVMITKYDREVELRYFNRNNINLKAINIAANTAFKEGNYEQCIKLCLMILSDVFSPKFYNYELLGFAYRAIGKNAEAIKYFTIASKLNKNAHYDYLLNSNINEPKKRANPTICDFYAASFNKIPNIDTILQLILVEGLNIDETCKQFNLSDSHTNMIKLALVQEYYIRGNTDLAEDILAQVRRSPHKTAFIIELLAQFSQGQVAAYTSIQKRILEQKS